MGLGLEQPSHLAVIAVLALLLFGYKKLPDMARSAGKSLRIFKTEMKGMAEDDDARAANRPASAAAPVPPAAITPAPPATQPGYATAPRDVPAANLDPTAPPATN